MKQEKLVLSACKAQGISVVDLDISVVDLEAATHMFHVSRFFATSRWP